MRMEGIWLEKHFNIPSEPQPDGPGHPCISDRRAIKEAQIHRNMLGLRSRVMHVCPSLTFNFVHLGQSTSVPSRISFGFPLTLQISFMPKHGDSKSSTTRYPFHSQAWSH